MRVAILSHSFSAAWRIHLGLASIEDLETFIILSPSPARGVWTSALSNLVQAVIGTVRNPGNSWRFDLRRLVFLTKGFNHPDSVASLEKLELDVGLHKSGVIYRDGVIAAFRLGILNPHIGLLPKYRGRSVMEWSLLNGDPVGITVFFIDTGIDTGARIVVSEEVDISQCRSITEAKQHLFAQDVSFFKKALGLLRAGDPSFKVNDGSGRRYYVMSKLFHDVVEQLIQESN
jgi:methionyl-tRNA formyltransferase